MVCLKWKQKQKLETKKYKMLIYYLSSEFAFGSLRDISFCLDPMPPPPPPKRTKHLWVSRRQSQRKYSKDLRKGSFFLGGGGQYNVNGTNMLCFWCKNVYFCVTKINFNCEKRARWRILFFRKSSSGWSLMKKALEPSERHFFWSCAQFRGGVKIYLCKKSLQRPLKIE